MEFEKRFTNWVKWCLRDGRRWGHCGSVEYRWRPPQCWEEPQPRPEELDILDARFLNNVFPLLESKWRRTIKFVYFKRWRAQWIAQKLGIHHTSLDHHVWLAKQEFAKRVDLVERLSLKSRARTPNQRETVLSRL